MAAPEDRVAAWLSAVDRVVREDPADQAVDREDLDRVDQVDPVVVREDPVDLAAGQEDSVDFPVVPAAPVGQEDLVEAAVAGVLQAVEHSTPRKSLK